MKKVLSIVLALAMIFTAFGSTVAYAANKGDAQTAVDAYNAADRGYYKDIMAGVSDKEANELADKLGNLLKEIITKVDAKKIIYSDNVAATLICLLNSLLGSGYENDVSKEFKTLYPVADYYVKDIKDKNGWKTVDKSKLVFGIDGDKDAFIKAVANGTSNFGGLLGMACLLGAAGMGEDIVKTVLVPLEEMLHVDSSEISNDYLGEIVPNKLGGDPNDGTAVMTWLLTLIADNVIEKLLANPLDTIIEILPEFAQNWDGMLDAINAAIKALAGSLLGEGGLNIPTASQLPVVLGNALGLKLDPIDAEKLALMGTATVTDSKTEGGSRLTIEANRPVVTMALVGYIKNALKNNASSLVGNNTIGSILGSVIGNVSNENLVILLKAVADVDSDTILDVINGANGDTLGFAQKIVDLLKEVCTNVPNKVGGISFIARCLQVVASAVSFLIELFAKVKDFFSNLGK